MRRETRQNAQRPGSAVGESELDLGIVQIPLLDTRATPALVTWTGAGNGPASLLADGSCLLYLGTFNSVVTLYDTRAGATFRLPAANLALELHPDTAALPVSCRES